MNSVVKLSVAYFVFALIATFVNLLTQRVVFSFSEHALILYAAMVCGTGTGLVTKYYLDKKYIFKFEAQDKKDDMKKFMMYSVVGGFTTLIYIAFEMSFFYLLAFPGAQYLGAIVGLSIGYVSKYFLDKRYVFRTHQR